LACELAEYVSMIQPIDLPVEINRLNVIIESDDNEISIPNKSNNENELDALENDNANVSMTIQYASNQVKNLIQEDNWKEQNFMDSFNEGHTQLNLITVFSRF